MSSRLFRIKNMAQHHVDSVVSIDQKCNPNPWSGSMYLKEISNPTHISLVAIIDESNNSLEHIVGFVGGQIISDEFHIHSLCVDPDYRRQGAGEELIRNAISRSLEFNVQSATLEVRVSNKAALELYEKLGFKSEGIRKFYYADNGEDAVIMWCRDLNGKGHI